MSLTMTPQQRGFMSSGDSIRSLAEWMLRTNSSYPAEIRGQAGLDRSEAPTRKDTRYLVDYLCSGRLSETVLVRLINLYTNTR